METARDTEMQEISSSQMPEESSQGINIFLVKWIVEVKKLLNCNTKASYFSSSIDQ